jgi:cathepsin L
MKTILALAVLLGLAYALSEAEYQTSFSSWMQKHKKSYHHDEFLVRYRTFKSNLDFIHAHNAKNLSFTVAMNKFGDLSVEEFSRTYLGTKFTATGPMKTSPPQALPSSWNWKNHGAVTHIKNQEQCGSCWSFSTTGSTEGCHFITTKNLVSLSEQNLMDCSTSQGNQGCNGGLMT